jgi:hypothetical protein
MTRLRRGKALRLASALSLAMLLAGPLGQTPSLAQSERAVASAAANFLNPFPENDTWRAMVIGDGMAEGLLVGLLDAMQGENRFQIQRPRRSLTTLGRVDIESELRSVDERITKEKIHVAIVMLGIGDRWGARAPNGRRLAVGGDEWRTEYAARVDKLVKALRRRNLAVYWVGLPIMRRQDWSDDVEAMNGVFRERAISNGARFIDIYTESADESGGYSDRGPDITGKVVRLRDGDGVDFTPAGYRKIAFFVERTLKRDMSLARDERAVPLAGSEEEQRSIRVLAAEARPPVPAKAAKAASRPPAGSASAVPAPPPSQERLPPLQRAETVRVSFKTVVSGGRFDQVALDVVRPALPTSIVTLVTRRDKGDRASQVGDTVTDTLSNGLMVMRSITPTSRQSTRATRDATTRQPFFIALVRGERLPPKPGRADDYRWPREDDLPLPPGVEEDRAAPIASPVQLGPQQQQQRRRRSRN